MSPDRWSKRLLDVAADAVGTILGALLLGLMLHGVAQGRLYGYLIAVFLVASSIYMLVSMVRRRRRKASSSPREDPSVNRTPQQPG